jgi:hypothetical protein
LSWRIYEVLVKYLCERKAERQIIMVSHDANLVIGADSEQVIVANRHGDEGREKRTAGSLPTSAARWSTRASARTRRSPSS